MKKIILAAALLFAFAGFSSAQTDSTRKPHQHVKKDLQEKKKMKEELGINKNQGQQIKQINQEYKAKTQAIKSDTTLNKELKKEKLKTIQKEKKDTMRAVLNPEQKEKLKKIQEERKAKPRRGVTDSPMEKKKDQ